MDGKPLVFNIQKFSTHDGDGVRTTIFFKGCPLKCRWCHNPESQRYEKELIFHHNKCVVCGKCVVKCPQQANSIVDGKLVFDRDKCTACGVCTDWCIKEAREIAGKEYTVDELVKEAKKDQIFYEQSGGGVTLSGGEVMAQNIDYIEQLCKRLHREGISVFIDTSGYTKYENLKRLIPITDVFLYDIKAIDSEEHKDYIGVDNALILENLVKLSNDGAGIYARLPIIGKVNATDEYINSVIRFLEDNHVKVQQVNLLPYHDIGKGKYASLDRPYDEASMVKPDKELMEHFKAMFEEHGFTKVLIGG
ncbi:MAG: glycyl-radical enzyme activating protein [Clostridium sp.]|nr:glycyl-radical enzyme activating protein [Clostridium sp.]MBP3216560.1 glycyl-radical enzyme activating protein [Clostridium sp.]